MYSKTFYCGAVNGPTKPRHTYHERRHERKIYEGSCYAKPSASPYVKRMRLCEHMDDSEVMHNLSRSRSECTSYNATCADDADDLLRHCLPEVYVDHKEVRDSIAKERAESLDPRFNMGNMRYSRFNDYAYVAARDKHVGHVSIIKNEVVDDVVVLASGDASKRGPVVGADADPFDVWPTIRSEFPVMVRRPDDYSKLYTKYY